MALQHLNVGPILCNREPHANIIYCIRLLYIYAGWYACVLLQVYKINILDSIKIVN